MRRNMGSIDKILRLAAAVIIAAFYFTDHLNGAVGVLTLVMACALALTGLVRICPLYALFRISTDRAERPIR